MRRNRNLVLTGAVGAAIMTLASCAAQPEPPATAVYIEGDWQCLTGADSEVAQDKYTYHLRVEPSSISVGAAPTGEALTWSHYDYSLSKDGTLTTSPQEGGSGWVIYLPEELSYDSVNTTRIVEGWSENLEIALSASEASWTTSTGLEWVCSRGTFEDDGNTFVPEEG